MAPLPKPLLLWAPRVLAILFAAFVAVFALDVFDEGLGIWMTIAALLLHLVPTAIILVALFIAWRWPVVGALFFLGLGALYLVTAWGRLHWSAYAVISGPLFLIGALFLVDALYRAERVVSQSTPPGC